MLLLSLNVKRETQPDWYTDDIKTATKIEMKVIRKKDWHNYKYCRNKCNHLKRQAKKHFFENAISKNMDNSYLWKHIESLTGQMEESTLPEELMVDDIAYNYPQDEQKS